MKRLITVFAILFSLFAANVATAPSVYAWNPFGRVDCSGEAANSAVCSDRANTEDPIAGPDGLIMKIVNILAFVAGAAAVIIIILSGLRMITSGGSSEDVAGARRALIYAVVGLVVIVLARTLIAFVISAL